MDYRHFSVKKGVIPHANGSAQLQLDTTDVLVGINLEIGEPSPDTPGRGRVCCSVECTTSASAEFEGRGAQDMNVVLSEQLETMMVHSNAIDLEGLCIIPGQTCWVLYIDALVLDCAGSLLDAISLCTRAALGDTLMPAVTVVQGDKSNELEIEVNDDPYEAKPLDLEKVGLCVSLTKVGPCFIADACLEEEQCMAMRISVTVDRQGRIGGVDKMGAGGLAPSGLSEMLRSARKIGLELHRQLDAATIDEADNEGSQ